MNFGLKSETISAIQSVMAHYPQVEKAILYGSRARGNFRNGSDIDLTLTGSNLDLDLLLKIENAIDDLLLPYKMDLSLLNHIENPDLIAQIHKFGRVFYQKK
ncbi:MAG: nucleotidyltransferase domain-containing protein [Fibrobacter sp.]|nr:nucleotidyltransferase domain-containing protein [Fibrobacter sp.]